MHGHTAPLSCSHRHGPQILFLRLCTHGSLAQRHTCAPHLATYTYIQSPLLPPWLWAPGIWARLAGWSFCPDRPTSAPPPSGRQVHRPGPRLVGREGAVITRPQGLSPSTRLSSRPRPTRAQTLITASRPVISRGRGRTRRPAGRAQRGGLGVRCGSAAATPPSPWQREWVRCPAPRKWGGLRAGACGGASCECAVDLRPNPRPAGQAASRASRPRIAASPPPKAILSPLSPTTPSALAEEWDGGGLRAGREPPPTPMLVAVDWTARRVREPLASLTTRPQRPLVSSGRTWSRAEAGSEVVPAPYDHPPHPAAHGDKQSLLHTESQGHAGSQVRIQVSHLRRKHTLPTLCPGQAHLRTGIHRHRSTLRWEPRTVVGTYSALYQATAS